MTITDDKDKTIRARLTTDNWLALAGLMLAMFAGLMHMSNRLSAVEAQVEMLRDQVHNSSRGSKS